MIGEITNSLKKKKEFRVGTHAGSSLQRRETENCIVTKHAIINLQLHEALPCTIKTKRSPETAVDFQIHSTKILMHAIRVKQSTPCTYLLVVADAISPPQSEKEGAHRKKQKPLLYHCERGRSGVPCLRQTRYEQSFAARMQGCRRISNIRRRGGCPLRRIRSSKRRKPRHCAR